MTRPTRRQTILTLAALAAAGGGAAVAWRRQMTASAPASGELPPQGGAEIHQHEAAASASAPVIQGDQLSAAFWQQRFDTPTGQTLALSKAQGRPLLLNFWATWCPPCVKEMPELARFQREFGPQGWQVIGLAIDSPTPVKEFLTKVAVAFDIGLAGFGGTELAQALGNQVGGLPFSVLIDAQGRVIHRKMGATHFTELAKWASSAGK